MGATDGFLHEHKNLLDHGPASDRWNLVILSEGYQELELADFHSDADMFLKGLLSSPPFDAIDVESAINIWRIDVSSKASGADDPALCGGTGFVAATYFDATFCLNGLPRLIGVNHDLVILVVGM